ncbi:hypothetical protein BDV96DRAFT_490937 [Lophiotrema nucula]|uniref:Uncharacterized protein n=1 Tax=Lophiotrema nucula TaxID=690887 RepID=A0A6A5ZEU8_9PLEO|nr:hypothetical protein BDV96DRAFT_490937 [Lophiotrema nucula]
MFTHIKTSLRSSLPEECPGLAEGEDSCFHSIRALTVGGRHEDPDLYELSGGRYPSVRFSSHCEQRLHERHVGPQYDARFSSLMQQLRNDQLLEFESPRETPLTAAQLVGLLRRHSNLRSFRARLDLSNIAIENRTAWTAENTPLFMSALRSLKTLRIYVGYESVEAGREGRQYVESCNGLLLKAAPLLDSLEICGWPHLFLGWTRECKVPLMAVFGNSANSIQMPQSLSHLLLADLVLDDSPERLLSEINVAALRSLKLEYCRRPWGFLRRLGTTLRRTNAQLKALTIRTGIFDASGMDQCLNGEMTDLFLSFAGLEKLEFDTLWTRVVDWNLCLGPHRTLKSLLISYRHHQGEAGLSGMIAGILRQCPHLQSFGYNPLCFSIEDVLDCQLPSFLPSELYNSLDAVAMAPALHTLRLLYAPGLCDGQIKKWPIDGMLLRGNPEWAEKAGQIAHREATLILAHLHSRGSKIRILALSPASRWEQHRGDSNLHYYPHYFYKSQMVGRDGNQVVEAVPIRDYVAECPDAAVFV